MENEIEFERINFTLRGKIFTFVKKIPCHIACNTAENFCGNHSVTSYQPIDFAALINSSKEAFGSVIPVSKSSGEQEARQEIVSYNPHKVMPVTPLGFTFLSRLRFFYKIVFINWPMYLAWSAFVSFSST